MSDSFFGSAEFGESEFTSYPDPRPSRVTGTLSLADRGGGNLIVLNAGGVSLSWQLAGPGTLSAFLTSRDARRLGASGDNWAGSKWVYFEHPDLPTWGGVITQPHWTPGLFELGCESFHVLARKRRVPRTYGQQRATAGALAHRAYTDVQSDDDMLLQWGGGDETGDPIDYEWRGGDLHDDVWRELADASGQEYDVDAERLVYWRVKLGEDKTGTVLITAPNEIGDHDYAADLWTLSNDVEGVASDTKYADSAYAQLDDETSIKERGRYQTQQRYAHVVTKGTVLPKLKADLNRLKELTKAVSFPTANVAHSWAKYHIGDTISVVLPDTDSRIDARIEARAIDIVSGVETLGISVQ